MDNFKLIWHLRRRYFELQREWVRQAGLYYLISQGHTYESTKGAVPKRLADNFTLEKELKFRKLDLDTLERDLEELEAEIQRVARSENAG